MSFWITIAKPLPKEKRASIQRLKDDGFFELSELGVWIGEYGGDADGWVEVSGFVWEPEYVCRECPGFNGSLSGAISGDAREMLLDTVRVSLPRGHHV